MTVHGVRTRSRSAPVRRVGRAEAGQAVVWVAVMLPLLLSVAGLAVDGGIVFAARRELQNAADSAARAGAMQLDERAYRESGGARVVLDARRAREAAADHVALRGGADAENAADAARVLVTVWRDVPTGFLRLAGIERVRVSAAAPAEVRHGVERGSR